MIDIDGVICEHIPNEFPEKMKTAEEIAGARKWINSKFEEGNYICFFTARLEEHRKITKKWLRDCGFKYHRIIFGKPRGGNYHYIDRIHVQATTFKGKFSPMVSVTHGIEVFDDSE
ncbi:MAG: phosphoheptose isomerase [Nitrososphaerales archaeon]